MPKGKMSRHKNVRNMNLNKDQFRSHSFESGDDHRNETDICAASPGTIDQYIKPSRHDEIANMLRTSITESPENVNNEDSIDNFDYNEDIFVNEMDETDTSLLKKCLSEMKISLNDNYSQKEIEEAAHKCNYDAKAAVDLILLKNLPSEKSPDANKTGNVKARISLASLAIKQSESSINIIPPILNQNSSMDFKPTNEIINTKKSKCVDSLLTSDNISSTLFCIQKSSNAPNLNSIFLRESKKPSSFASALTFEKCFYKFSSLNFQKNYFNNKHSIYKLTPFDFIEPSPDDLVLSRQKGSLKHLNYDNSLHNFIVGSVSGNKKVKAPEVIISTNTVKPKVSVDNLETNEIKQKIGQVSISSNENTPKKTLNTPNKLIMRKSQEKEKYDLNLEFKKRQEMLNGKELINMVVCGHVDAGKSTLMGHLLVKLGNFSEKTLHKIKQDAIKINKQCFWLAFIMDELDEERERGVTMDIAKASFQTENKIVNILDAPGHKDYIPKMIGGTSQADVAIMVVNAAPGEFETGYERCGQTREHAMLLRSIGIQQIIVVVNKMDVVNWDKNRYDNITTELKSCFKTLSIKEKHISFIPVSGFYGLNLTEKLNLPETSWYEGPTLIEQINKFKAPVRSVDAPFRMSISDVYKGTGNNINVDGRIVSGGVQLIDRVLLLPSNDIGVVKGIQINDQQTPYAFSGDSLTLSLSNIELSSVFQGNVLCSVENPMNCSNYFQATIILFNVKIPITNGFNVELYIQEVCEPATIFKLLRTINYSKMETIKKKPRFLKSSDTADVTIQLSRNVPLEEFKILPEFGRFTMRFEGETIGAGAITKLLPNNKENS